eukprot:CAMPEP_0182612062 /NCGR_PEP_ID=MMETSP1330-20130603/16614_1 /TAXON_ID=464278 /ORGANISM="Picochlorum sp., Strain RCC944" /LENGTH=206 /DNA_ID=CAMNT_0024831549 /DNA_START=67 /DNA_END=684 /DNA_ORIENTATION=+
MRGSSASQATTAVRWNSHEHLTKRRAAPAVRAAAGVAAPRTLAYAVRINSLSRGLVKAALCVALFSIFGKRFLQGQGLGASDGATDGATGTGGYEGHNGWDERVGMGSGSALRSALGSAMVVLEVVVARGDLLQSVAGWVCLVMAGPLVVSAMVLNNSERLSSLSSTGRALGVSQGWRDRNGLGGAGKDGLLDARGGAQEHSTLTI